MAKKSKEEKTLTVKCLYDSDDYNNSELEKKNKLTKWEDTKIDDNTGKIVKTNMFHIYYGVSVPYKNWKRAINAATSYTFLRELVVPHIWSLREFVQGAIQIDRTNDQEERVELTPRKREALKRGYVQYLLERNLIPYKVSTQRKAKSRKGRINKFGRELGIIICQERSKLLVRHDEEAENSTHSPRESDVTEKKFYMKMFNRNR
ncbi:hypothetical protein TSAR_007275 [Trichomalopsis sarcophagae]|uniref:Uncharacterized protein n=1 Tax=Trichomalopsis sarcophagae TaxID=543379 RepID=A0A232ER58_9HYME|nr:hypothetical protein TSAR_007275 [Trichomalopsis sarcophagae]